MWLAKDSLLDRKVICKRIDQRFARRADWRSTLVALADAALKSRTIPQLFGVQTVGDSCWLIQEFVQGTTLEMALQDRPTRLGDRSILLVAMDLLAAAVAFRAVGLVHGDINPANVLIDATGRARVIDFNCAALIGENFWEWASLDSVDRMLDRHRRQTRWMTLCHRLPHFLAVGTAPAQQHPGLEGHLLVSAAPCPKSPSRLEDLLWRTARDLTVGARHVPGRSRHIWPGCATRRGCCPPMREMIWSKGKHQDRGDCAFNALGYSVFGHIQGAPDCPRTWETAAVFRFHCSERGAPCGPAQAVANVGPGVRAGRPCSRLALAIRAPYRHCCPAQIAANTVLPPSFSMDWLASELRQALSAANAGALPPNEVLQLSLHCSHRACTLVLHPSTNPGERRYELQFVASHEHGVWQTAITELARLVATP